MIETPQIIKTEARLTAVIRIIVPRKDIHKAMGPGMEELMEILEDQGIETDAAMFSHHLRLDPAVFDFELGIPVPKAVNAVGRVKPGQWPAVKAARTTYRGPYEGLGPAWEEFDDWIEAQGHIPGADLWESYVAGPESGEDPSTWRTELIRPLI